MSLSDTLNEDIRHCDGRLVGRVEMTQFCFVYQDDMVQDAGYLRRLFLIWLVHLEQ